VETPPGVIAQSSSLPIDQSDVSGEANLTKKTELGGKAALEVTVTKTIKFSNRKAKTGGQWNNYNSKTDDTWVLPADPASPSWSKTSDTTLTFSLTMPAATNESNSHVVTTVSKMLIKK
jgi:hypothetical protein